MPGEWLGMKSRRRFWYPAARALHRFHNFRDFSTWMAHILWSRIIPHGLRPVQLAQCRWGQIGKLSSTVQSFDVLFAGDTAL
jgi:hypothetical protein